MRRPRPAWLLLAVSLVMILAALAWISVASAPVEETSVGQRPGMSAAASEDGAAAAAGDPSTARDARGIGVVAPDRLAIPAIGVDARVVPVGMDESRGVAVPDDIRLVGWWRWGVAPGTPRGSAVLVAHRDGVEQGQGVFYPLGALQVGDRVTVTDRAGRAIAYEVAAREYIRRRALPVTELFAVDGPPRLTLISCGGPYVKSQGGYQDNIVVTATPLQDGAS